VNLYSAKSAMNRLVPEEQDVIYSMLSSVWHMQTYHTLWCSGYLQCGQSTFSIMARLQLQATDV